jgi:hypothetical protein
MESTTAIPSYVGFVKGNPPYARPDGDVIRKTTRPFHDASIYYTQEARA